MCTTPDRMDEAKYQMQRQGWHKAPQWLVTPEEIAKMHPLLKMDDVLGGLFNPGQFYGMCYMYKQLSFMAALWICFRTSDVPIMCKVNCCSLTLLLKVQDIHKTGGCLCCQAAEQQVNPLMSFIWLSCRRNNRSQNTLK